MILTEEQQRIRDTARDFARRELAPHSAEWDQTAKFPREAVHGLGKLGFYQQIGMPQDAAYAYAVQLMAEAAVTADAQEGISAFLGKRPPAFAGRANDVAGVTTR